MSAVFREGFVWDWLPWNDGEIIADSQREYSLSFEYGARMELPALRACRLRWTLCPREVWPLLPAIAMGGIDGLGGSAKLLSHHCPVVLAFDFQGDCLFLDRYGAVFREGRPQPLVRLPVATVWRARLVDGKALYQTGAKPETAYGWTLTDGKFPSSIAGQSC